MKKLLILLLLVPAFAMAGTFKNEDGELSKIFYSGAKGKEKY